MEYGKNYTEYQTERNRIRHLIRRYYIKNVLKFVKGRCIDFGCGSGDILKYLPVGSIGTDINKHSIKYCLKNNLKAEYYPVEEDKYELKCFGENYFGTIIFSHVLEHIPDTESVFITLFKSINRLGIDRIIIVVPGIKGFRHDKTHITYIDQDYIRKNKFDNLSGFRLIFSKYFPVNSKTFSKYFTHNELVMVYDRIKEIIN